MKHLTRTLALILISIFTFSSSFGCLKIVVESGGSMETQTGVQQPEEPRQQEVQQKPEEPIEPPTPEWYDPAEADSKDIGYEEPVETPTPVPPTPTDEPLPSSFFFGGVEVAAGQTSVKVTGKKNAIIRITPEEMDLLIKLCPKLTNMELDYCCMADYSRIGELTSLKHLQITTTTHSQDYGIPLVDIDWTASLKNLRYLCLTYNKINDIRALSNLTNLEELNLGWNELSDEDLRWLEDLNLKALYLYCNEDLRNVSGLASIKSLETLHIGGNRKLSGFTELNTLPNLKWLDISYLPVKDFSWVKGFKRLETLRIVKTEYLGEDYYYHELANCKTLKTIYIAPDDTEIEWALRDMIYDMRPDIELLYYEN